MFNFFLENSDNQAEKYHVAGSDYNHIKNVLRMKVGDKLLISVLSASNLCEIESFTDNEVVVKVIERNYQDASLPIKIYLFQGLPKSDKLELIIQKAVELGASVIVPTETSRSIVKIEEKKKESKTERWQKIAESAAKQSKCSSIPKVICPINFKNALELAKELDLFLVPYENAEKMFTTKTALSKIKSGMKVGVFIGPEGGFDESEIEKLKEIGSEIISLGKRILRTETASITALSMLMLYSEMNLD